MYSFEGEQEQTTFKVGPYSGIITWDSSHELVKEDRGWHGFRFSSRVFLFFWCYQTLRVREREREGKRDIYFSRSATTVNKATHLRGYTNVIWHQILRFCIWGIRQDCRL